MTNSLTPRTLWPEKPIIAHQPNTRGRDLVIGDLHGHFDTLENALVQLGFNAHTDRLFSVGDLIDHGPRSEAALEWIRDAKIASVRGNHEQLMIDTLALERGELHKSGRSRQWLDCGADWWFGFDGVDEAGWPKWHDTDHNERRAEWLAALHTVPYARSIETAAGTVGIVHTMPDYYQDWDRLREDLYRQAEEAKEHDARFVTGAQTPIGILWQRPDVETERRDAPELCAPMAGITLALIGHTPEPSPRWNRRNVLCIDTGVHIDADGYGHLTIAEVQTGQPRLHRFERVEIPRKA